MKDKFFEIAKACWKVISRNLGLKFLAVIFALMLWSYVISSNTDITRTKTHTGLQGYVTGQASLDVYNLAMVTDPTEVLSNVTVDVDVPQINYTASTADNVQVMLDLSSVRTAGAQEVPIKATSSYGKVTRVYPSSVTLNFEPVDSRSIPVNVQMTGADEEYWYNFARVNPSQITISGATSIVQDISSVVVNVDVTGHISSFNTSCSLVMLDSEGNVVPNTLLNRSSSSVSISMEVYPTKELEVSTSTNDVLVGQIADGYIVEAIIVQPRTITVAAEQELLDSLDKLIIEPIEIDGVSQTFTRKASVSGLSDFRYISSEQIYVNVQIAEETISDWVEDVPLTFIGLDDDLEISEGRGTVAVHVTGPRSKIEAISSDDLSVIVDLSGLPAGSYELPVEPDTDNYPSVVFEVDPANIQVTLSEITAE